MQEENKCEFCKGIFCPTCLKEFFERINKHMDNRNLIHTVRQDLQKTSDEVLWTYLRK